jgi:hypothetical protein
MVEVSVKVDTRAFDAAFHKYMAVTRHSLAEICNKKAAYIATRALKSTKRASRASIEASLGKKIVVSRTTKKGRVIKSKKLSLVQADIADAPLAALIVNKRRGARGEPGLRGAEMATAVSKMINRRFSSIGFIASGWIKAIQELSAALKERFSYDRKVKAFGKVKGGATAAKPGWNPTAIIFNNIDAKGSQEVKEYITEGVQKALDAEAASMEQYVESKLAKDAARF